MLAVELQRGMLYKVPEKKVTPFFLIQSPISGWILIKCMKFSHSLHHDVLKPWHVIEG